MCGSKSGTGSIQIVLKLSRRQICFKLELLPVSLLSSWTIFAKLQNFLSQNIVSCALRYNRGEANNKFITPQWFLSSDYHTDVQTESELLLYTFWSLVMVRSQLPAQVVNWKTMIFHRTERGLDLRRILFNLINERF